MDLGRIRDEQQLAALLDEIRSFGVAAQISRLSQARQSLELDELYYEQKGNEAGIARISRCLALIDERLTELQSAP